MKDQKRQQLSLPPLQLSKISKESLLNYFINSWELNEVLFSSITDDKAFFMSPDPLRNPLIFYFGHTAAFYINKLKLVKLIENGVNDKLDNLFAVGVDPNLPQELEISEYWPTLEETKKYRSTIFTIVTNFIANIDFSKASFDINSPYWALLMAIEHARIHFETSSVLLRQLDCKYLKKPINWKYAPTFGQPEPNEWIEVEKGTTTLGKPQDSDIFGWNNEYGLLNIEVKPFLATKNLISNHEYLLFVESGEYANKTFWTAEGWEWKIRTKTQHPKFWVRNENTFLYRTMFDILEMPLDWPVEVNAHEAIAFINWKNEGSRLLSEAEFNFIAKKDKSDAFDPVFSQSRFNLNFEFGSPTPVGYFKNGVSSDGFNDLYGNVWEWLQDDFYALPNYKAHPFYLDFAEPYMDSEHSMMAGGSWITTGTGASKYYRLWFRRHFYQHAGFRMAKTI